MVFVKKVQIGPKTCSACKDGTTPATIGCFCEYHYEQYRAREDAKRERKKAAGVCLRCDQPTEDGTTHCNKHRRAVRLESTKRRKVYKEEAKCSCGQMMDPGFLTCGVCREKEKNRSQTRTEEALLTGKCRDCKEETVPFKSRCQNCLNYWKEWAKKNPQPKAYRRSIKSKPFQRFKNAQEHLERRNKKIRGNRKPLTWNIDFKTFCEFLAKPCYYCDGSKAGEVGSGLDRIDNDIGYEVGNVLPCCGICNRIRNEGLTVEEMREIGQKVIKPLRAKREADNQNLCMKLGPESAQNANWPKTRQKA